MGYETKLIFCQTYGKDNKGYWSVMATLNMGKIANNKFISNLIDKARARNGTDEQIKKKHELIKKFIEIFNSVYNSEGNYADSFQELKEKEQNKVKGQLDKIEQELNNKLPYIYYINQQLQSYEDDYGDLMLVVTLDELEQALHSARAEELLNFDGDYWKAYDIALTMIDSFKKAYPEYSEFIRVVMWGC